MAKFNTHMENMYTQKHELYIKRKDLDESTFRGEIWAALKEQFNLEELREEPLWVWENLILNGFNITTSLDTAEGAGPAKSLL